MSNTILHVEDNPDDVTLMEMAFRKAGVTAQIIIARDGDEAIAALVPGVGQPIPSLILLDIKLPSISGLEVLAWIRRQGHLKRVPVIMLTSSLLTGDINAAYDLGANSFLVKPSELEALVALARNLNHYWLEMNVRPMAGEG